MSILDLKVCVNAVINALISYEIAPHGRDKALESPEDQRKHTSAETKIHERYP